MTSAAKIVLAYLALQQQYYAPGTNAFTFTKARFLRAYRYLLREKVVRFTKYETLLRELRKLASSNSCVSYANAKGGVYRATISCLEREWPQAFVLLRKNNVVVAP